MIVSLKKRFHVHFFAILVLVHQSAIVWGSDFQETKEVASCSATDSICSTWRAFRERHPVPYQTFAVQELDGEAIVIISEAPPPYKTKDIIGLASAVFGKNVLEVASLRWPVGYDGWLEDIVLRVQRDQVERRIPVVVGHSIKREMFSSSLVDRMRIISRALHGTSEGFYLDQVSPIAEHPTHPPLINLNVSPEDVQHWVADPRTRWSPLIKDESKPLLTSERLLTARQVGAFESSDQRIIALTIPRHISLGKLAESFRQFSIASDFLVAAVQARNDGIVLFGRARQLPLAVLPPFRFETLARLVINKSDALYQSYERQRIFAGKISKGSFEGWDWAPILLSPQLQDSEFGMLLNLADQVLKSQSEAGNVEYFNFSYRKPTSWPFGEEPASTFFSRTFATSALIYNWNTRGFAAMVKSRCCRVMTVSDTSALPSIFIPVQGGITGVLGTLGADGINANSTANKAITNAGAWFRNQGDPILTRVSQNVFLYLIAENFLNIKGADVWAQDENRSDLVGGVLQNLAVDWLKKVVDEIASDETRAVKDQIRSFMADNNVSQKRLAELLASPQALSQQLISRGLELNRIVKVHNTLIDTLNATSDSAATAFKAFCAEANGTYTEMQSLRHCAGFRAVSWTAKLAEQRYQTLDMQARQYKEELDALRIEFERAQSNLKHYEKEEKSLRDLEPIISAALSRSENLDAVLESVVAATQGNDESTSMRTPTVVLSRNARFAEMIGGHNIDSKPTITQATFSPKSPIGYGDFKAARPMDEALEMADRPLMQEGGSGTLLEAMRGLPAKIDNPALLAKARDCHCDVFVQLDENGIINVIKPAPPASHEVVIGRSALVDLLASTRKKDVVVLNGFDPGIASAIADSVSLISRRSELRESPNTVQRWREVAAQLFRSPSITPVEVLSVARGGNSHPLQIVRSAEMTRDGLRHKPAWSSARIIEDNIQDPLEWAASRGLSARDTASGNSSVVVISFGNQPGGLVDKLHIFLTKSPSSSKGIAESVSSIVKEMGKARSSSSADLLQGITKLHDRIVKDLAPRDLIFFLDSNLATTKITEMTQPSLVLPPAFNMSGEREPSRREAMVYLRH